MESNDEMVRRIRAENERRQAEVKRDNERQQAEWKHDRERREDQQRQNRLSKETERHNRSVEAAALARSPPSFSSRSPAQSTDSQDYVPQSRGGSGLVKWLIFALMIWAAIHFWPEIRGLGQNIDNKSEATGGLTDDRPVNIAGDSTPDTAGSHTDGDTTDIRDEPVPGERQSNQKLESKAADTDRSAVKFAAPSEVVQKLPTSGDNYPPCSAAITDHCVGN